MGVSHLELQKQGFKIVKILSSLDSDYLQDSSINRMLRWLWRSRGRHLRLIHDESVPPRYHEESRDLGQFLVNYSRAHPNEVDVLFDLIRIFIHPVSTEDFSFIKEHLIKRVSCELSVEQKRLVLQRFSKLLSGGQGNLETKLVAAQMLIIPMLTDSRDEIFSDPSMKTLIESILSVTSSRRLETKMTCELLQITELLLKKMLPDDISGYRRELLKWIWDVLKVNDPSAKYHAYLAVSRFISTFETPAKVSQQVLKGLYRSGGGGQHDSLVQMSLDVLLPVLKVRLNDEEFETSMQYVLTIMKEEERPFPQQITLWKSIDRHSDVFVGHKNEITPNMLHFIKLLGQHASVERINLVVALSSLFIKWNVDERESHEGYDVMNILIEQAFMMITRRRSDQSCQSIRAQILSVVEAVVSSSKCSGSAINSAPFENVLVYIKERHQDDTEEGSNSKKSDKSSWKDSHSSSKHEFQIEGNALLLCAEIILILLRCDPKNDFLGLKVCSSILNQCMSNVMSSTSEHSKLAKVLEELFSHILVSEETSDEMTATVIAILENAIRLSTTNRSSCFAISVIEKIWKTNQDFIEPFTGTLASVASQLVEQHINEVLATDSSEYPSLLAATPTQGILEEACNIGVVKSSSKHGDDMHKNQLIVQNEALSPSLNTVISIMTILSSSDALLTFSNTRNMILTTLSSILDRSNSLPLLLSAVSIVGNWLLSDDQTQMPLTKSEREGLVLQLALFDSNKEEAKTHTVVKDLISCIALKAYGYGSSDSHVTQGKVESMQKVLVSCLLSANPHIREVSLDMFMSKDNKCIENILKKLLELDFESLGQYMWTTVISDILLASCKSEKISSPGQLKLHHDKKQEHATEVDTSTNDYTSFTKALALEKNSSESSCLAAIRSLVQGDVSTSESMLNVSFQAAWQSLTNSSRASIISLLERLLAKPYHSQKFGQKNAVQSILRLLVSLHPTPTIDPFLLQSLAVDYNVSSEVLYLLEGQYVSLKANGYEIDSSLLRAIHNIYKQLGERDVCLAIESSSAMSVLPGTKFALSLAMYDYVDESSNAFLSLIDQVGENDDDLMPTECEMALWEERWVETQREMSQVRVVHILCSFVF